MDNEDDAGELEIVSENEEGEAAVQKLRERIKKCQSERDEYLAGWQRARADFINMKKDEEKAREEFLKFAEKNMLRELIDVVDNFDMAFVHGLALPEGDKNWIEGIKGIHVQLAKLLENHGVVPLDADVGQKFDPVIHEAIEKIDVEDMTKDGTIIEVVKRGYKLHDKILRPAMVKVGVHKLQN
ncbi:MAG: nucleotide exchange factor GrpE [Candidatus Niyogibacteria bacterium]|nr:nucleotide exchange factor GrpE [Candidatus Niyogibacteria bacterium]